MHSEIVILDYNRTFYKWARDMCDTCFEGVTAKGIIFLGIWPECRYSYRRRVGCQERRETSKRFQRCNLYFFSSIIYRSNIQIESSLVVRNILMERTLVDTWETEREIETTDKIVKCIFSLLRSIRQRKKYCWKRDSCEKRKYNPVKSGARQTMFKFSYPNNYFIKLFFFLHETSRLLERRFH